MPGRAIIVSAIGESKVIQNYCEIRIVVIGSKAFTDYYKLCSIYIIIGVTIIFISIRIVVDILSVVVKLLLLLLLSLLFYYYHNY